LGIIGGEKTGSHRSCESQIHERTVKVLGPGFGKGVGFAGFWVPFIAVPKFR